MSFDNEMIQLSKTEQTYIPNNDRVVNIDFFPYTDYCYVIYQYQKKNVVYCMAARVDGNGNWAAEPVELDSAHIGGSSNIRYTPLVVTPVKTKARSVFSRSIAGTGNWHYSSTLLFNDKLQLQEKSRLEIPMEERTENLESLTWTMMVTFGFL